MKERINGAYCSLVMYGVYYHLGCRKDFGEAIVYPPISSILLTPFFLLQVYLISVVTQLKWPLEP